jgi:hypothetical protein
VIVEREVLTAIVKKSLFWDVSPCSPLTVIQARNQHEAGNKQLDDGFLLDLFFELEDGGDMFLRNELHSVISQKITLRICDG